MLQRILTLLLVGLIGTFAACSTLREAQSPRAALFTCRANALEPLVGDTDAAIALARRIYAGELSLAQVVAGLKPAQAELQALLAALNACEPPATAPATLDADAGVQS